MSASWKKWIWGIFIVVFVLELGVGYYLASIYGFMSGDASSRVANAFYVLYSREPGLANIGFVWNPLPSLMQLVILVFYPIFPALASEGLAAVILSALFAALTAVLIMMAGRKYGLSKWLTLVFAILYSFNPYIFYYGANGLTEVIFIYFINLAVLQMLLWMDNDAPRPLVVAALALALAFWTRYETVFFGAALAVAVLIWILHIKEDPVKERLKEAEGSWVLLLTPVVYSGLLWIFFNYIIMGDGFYFLTSSYSNLGQAELLMEDEKFANMVYNPIAVLIFVAKRFWYFSIPLLLVLLIRAIERRLFKWDIVLLVILAVSIPSMQIFLLLKGGTAAWIRYYMYVFPITAIWIPYEISKMRFRKIGAGVLIAGMAISSVVMFNMMNDPTVASDEYEAFRFNKLYAEQQAGNDVMTYVREQMHDEMILTDSFSSFRIIMGSGNPKQFVITSDSDFAESLEEPYNHDIDYVLIPNPEAVLSLDGVNQKYPGLYAEGAEWATLHKEFNGFWKLYKVKKELATIQD